MYTTHFKMSAQPFCERAPIEQILKDDRIQQGLARLQYFLEYSTIAMIVGQTGVGKSTLIKLFVNSLSPNRYRPVYIHFTKMKNTCLLKLIACELGEQPKIGKDRVLGQIVEKTRKSEQTVLLILDESHLLESDSLTDLRLLVSSALDAEPPLKLLLVGQESIQKKLQSDQHTDLFQRITVRYHLRPLTKEQTIDYIDGQISHAGASEKIFEPEVKQAIFEYTYGVPRQINNVASACLLKACEKKTQKINQALFMQTMAEFSVH